MKIKKKKNEIDKKKNVFKMGDQNL